MKMTEKENDNEIDNLAESFFKQIGMEDFSGALEFAKNVEADVKVRDSTLPPESKDMDPSEYEKLLKEKEDKIKEFEDKIVPALILMIKTLKDENRELISKMGTKISKKGTSGENFGEISALKEENKELLKKIEIKEKRIIELTEKITKFKNKILGLKSKWL